MRRTQDASNPHQTAFEFEEIRLPPIEAHTVKDAPLPAVPEYVPVYTVFLRRSNVMSVQQRPTIHSLQDVAKLVGEFLKETDREHFVIVLLDTKNAVIGINNVSVGILDSALVHPREVYKAAILSNAAAIILAHNHPSGDPTPSAEDRRITQRLYEAE